MSGGIRPTMGLGQGGWLSATLAGVVLLLLLVLCGVAARSGSWASAPSSSAAPSSAPVATEAAPAAHPAEKTVPPAKVRSDSTGGRVTAYLVFGVVVLLVLLGLALLTGLLHRPAWRRWTRRSPSADLTVEAADPGDDGGLPAAVHQALRMVADQPDARDAVVRAWLLLGEAAAAAGTPIRPAETATEYARRLATAHPLPEGAVERLAALYREARFSDHDVRPEQREAAHADLLALRAELGAPTDSARPR